MAQKEGRIVKQLYKNVLITTIIIFLMIAIIVSIIVYVSFEQQVKAGINKDAQIISEKVNSYLMQGNLLVEQMALNRKLEQYIVNDIEHGNDEKDPLFIEIAEYLREIEEGNDIITMVWIGISETNDLIVSDASFQNKSNWIYKERPWYSEIESKKGVIFTEPYKDSFTGEKVVSVIKPIIKNGKIIGNYGIDINTEDLYNLLSNYSIGENGYPILISGTGTILYHEEADLMMTSNIGDLPEPLATYGKKMMNGERGIEEYQGEKRLDYFAFVPVDVSDWSIGTFVSQDEILDDIYKIMYVMIIMFIVAILVLIVIIYYAIKKSLRKVPNLLHNMSLFAQGDLVTDYTINENNEIGKISNAFNDAIQSLKKVVYRAKHSSNDILKTSERTEEIAHETRLSLNQVTHAITQVAEGSTDQAIQSEKSVMSIRCLSEEIASVVDEAKALNKKVKEIHQLSNNGRDVIHQLGTQSEKNASSVNKIKDTIEDMDQSTNEINDIVTLINAISNQTNLLALNASIEAARAGEAGKGFAVVADEIRALAVQTNGATEEIQKRIEGIQKQSSEAVKKATFSREMVEENVSIVKNTAIIFTDIINHLSKLYEASQSTQSIAQNMEKDKEMIVAHIEQISATSEEISASMEEISATTEEQLAIMDNLSSEATALKKLAELQESYMSQFKI